MENGKNEKKNINRKGRCVPALKTVIVVTVLTVVTVVTAVIVVVVVVTVIMLMDLGIGSIYRAKG